MLKQFRNDCSLPREKFHRFGLHQSRNCARPQQRREEQNDQIAQSVLRCNDAAGLAGAFRFSGKE
jgi:hypothetical protein